MCHNMCYLNLKCLIKV